MSPPVRYCRSTLPPVHNAGSGSGRGAGLPPQARGGRLRHVSCGKIHRSLETPWLDASTWTCLFCFNIKFTQNRSLWFTGSNYIATLTLGSAGAHASYYHKANEQVTSPPFSLASCTKWIQSFYSDVLISTDELGFFLASCSGMYNTAALVTILLSASLHQLSVGVEFEASTRMQDTSVSFGYQLDVPKANLQFKGTELIFHSPWQISFPHITKLNYDFHLSTGWILKIHIVFFTSRQTSNLSNWIYFIYCLLIRKLTVHCLKVWHHG